MARMNINIRLENPCTSRKDFCINCHSRFKTVRPLIKNVIVSEHFLKDLKDEKEAESFVNDVLDCSRIDFTELHKFEENVNGNMIFRAKKNDIHVVYSLDAKMQIVFLRAFRNYNEYKRFLEDKKEIRKIIAHSRT